MRPVWVQEVAPAGRGPAEGVAPETGRLAARIYERLRRRPGPFWLDSAQVQAGMGRFSILGAGPFLVLRCDAAADVPGFLGRLQAVLDEYRVAALPPGLPFCAGAAGYLAYEFGAGLVQPRPARSGQAAGAAQAPACPLAHFGFYGAAVVCDHQTGRVAVAGIDQAAVRDLAGEVRDALAACAGHAADDAVEMEPDGLPGPLRSNFTPESYCRAVQAVREYIRAGDVYQVNLSQRLEAPWRGDPWPVYRRLRQLSPAPMAAFLEPPGERLAIASSSPERLVRLQDGRAETRPIKGTRPRGRNASEDARQRAQLWDSPKDRAELLMITDLARNDLGRVCRYGSVRVPDLVRVEPYAQVFHLVSTVVGELAEGKRVTDLLAAVFPGGSITGAPKRRAMEVIAELEGVPRGVYTGSIGYLDFSGRADLNIAIRTMIFDRQAGRVYLPVGGGVVIDSDPLEEYRETLAKAAGMLGALGVETEVGR